ncbi:hypothetical protein VTK73DRAFT_698 [Phialemonium thermophilum]|uniref:Uncharacterized protein n=1 Tax=Phialemonium thermophilum TaxID=223376 RepID=A0ABR3VUH3_9PEZI
MAPDEVTLDEITSMVAVCDELYRQLELWHASIPEPYRPPLTPLPPEGATDGGDYDHDDDDDRQAVLRIRYFAARHIIHRPFLLYIAANGVSQVAPSIVEKAGLCVESCRLYLHNTARILQKPSPYTWTFALSSLGAIVVLTLASLSPDLRHFVADIDELQSLAIRNIRPWAVSSLEVVVSILEDMQRKQRILSRV